MGNGLPNLSHSKHFLKSEMRIWHSMHSSFSTNSTLILMYEKYASGEGGSHPKKKGKFSKSWTPPLPRCYVPVEGICLIWSTIQLSNYIRSRWQPTKVQKVHSKLEVRNLRFESMHGRSLFRTVWCRYEKVSRFMILLVN